MNLAGKTLYVGMCCYRHEMRSDTCMGLLSLMKGCAERGIELQTFLYSDCPYVDLGKSVLLGNFMLHTDADYILILDSDMGFEFADVERLLDADVDVVSANYPTRSFPIRQLTRPENGRGLTKCGYVPGGFLLIKRAAISRLEESFQRGGRRPVNLLAGMNYFRFCAMSVDPKTDMVLGEDYTFCNNLRQAGIDIHCHFDVRVSHVGDHVFRMDSQTIAMSRALEQHQGR